MTSMLIWHNIKLFIEVLIYVLIGQVHCRLAGLGRQKQYDILDQFIS